MCIICILLKLRCHILFPEESTEIRCIAPLEIGAITALCTVNLKPPPKTSSKEAPCLILAGSADGRVAARLAANGGRKPLDIGLIWSESDRLTVRRIQLVDQVVANSSGNELTLRILLAKSSFVVVVVARLILAKKQWRLAETVTQSTLNAGIGTVVGMEVTEEGDVLVAAQKGSVLRWVG